MIRRPICPLGALILCVLAPLASCSHASRGDRANVLVIVIDTLRADHLGCYGYDKPTSPHIDTLAAQSTRFANARAASSWTLPSVASILTGVYPAVHAVEQADSVLADNTATMASAFRESGYDTAALSANPAFVTPQQGFARGFERFDVLSGPTVAGRAVGAVPANAALTRWVMQARADDVTSAALDWLKTRRPDAPFLLYLHYFDPHAAYSPPVEFMQRFGIAENAPIAGEAQWAYLLAPQAPPPDVLADLIKLYDAEIAATDAAVGRLLGAMPAELREKTIVVVTADHGEEFGDHGGVQHGRTLYDELIRVPLLVSGPGVPRGHVVKASVSLTGLWATLAELTGGAAPAPGVEPSFAATLVSEPQGRPPVYADLESRFAGDRQRHRRAVVDGTWKLLVDPQHASELYDLSTDATERHDVAEQRDLRERLRAEIQERDVSTLARRATAPARRGVFDAARQEQLRALGYAQ